MCRMSEYKSAALIVFALTATACGSGQSAGSVSDGTPTSTPAPLEATLILDNEECRDSGTVEGFDRTWSLADPAPFDWRDASPVEGTLTITDSQNANFNADGVDLRVTTGDQLLECIGWDPNDQ